jgi:GNAT superfamily N-acetyltransferase
LTYFTIKIPVLIIDTGNEQNIMDLICKKAGIEYLETLVDLRIEFIKDIHPEYDSNLLTQIHTATIKYFKDLFESNVYIGFLGMEPSGEIVCTTGLLIYNLPPLNSASYRKVGHVLNFFTKSQYRRNGYGLELMNFVKITAKQEGIARLVLSATKMGYDLYKKSSFVEPEEKWMVLDL